MSPEEFKEARQALGFTQTQMANALELEGSEGRRTIRYWETGGRPISGPVRVAVRLMLQLQARRIRKAATA